MVVPAPGQVLLGYELYRPAAGCCQCEGLSAAGLLSVILLVLVFWPLAWLPCVMPECFEPLQRPVYGFPAPGYGPPPAQGVPMQQQQQQQSAPAGYPPV
ncbi:lipopolysaccharide-induced transcription factor regulating tumor necrosis factor [Micractinium conductrix]|uniref:Lipopolysaccharide-induced transcription factor regulating tumor necrosis factor n=1 Tax=Micractinium conductrix TaxID=554055 RepID=A0A2P6V274_9CHLO|nr:lipopolysaccharide-induced transcription factor regulating tumor necrosis factor [Micractinium conductrix]|eukprot:PSC68195.1 lipopolysaccharide-induced transcription factor regulating tumor necrosis factor [Micractinium conductrix]